MNEVLAHIDAEIAKLQQVRSLLSGSSGGTSTGASGGQQTAPTGKKRGRPKGSKNASTTAASGAPAATKEKRKLSPEGRKAIADAMKRRWAERRKQPPK